VFQSEKRPDWCWFCDLNCQFIYDELKNKWLCTRCGRDLQHWGRQTEEKDVQSKNEDGRRTRGGYASYQREHPRFIVELPIDYSRTDHEEEHGGIAANASESGLLVYLPEFLDKGALLKIVILTDNGSECDTIKGVAKVVWGDLAAKAAWGKHRYGLEFQSFNRGSLDKLKILLKEVAKIPVG
jgi:hypothetical protein